jgi:DNA-binding MarR family transcriptional regulator
MGGEPAAATRRRGPRPEPRREPLSGVDGQSPRPDSREIDALIHNQLRLGILSALAAAPALSFNDLKALMRTTDGNLSVHARKLEDAQYVTCTKGFEGRRPRTEYRLTARGRRALQRYLDHMEAIIRATRGTLAR